MADERGTDTAHIQHVSGTAEGRALQRLCLNCPDLGAVTAYSLAKLVRDRGGRSGFHEKTAAKLLSAGLAGTKQPDIRTAVLKALGATPDEYAQAVAAERNASDVGAAEPPPALASVPPSPPAWGLVRDADAPGPLGPPPGDDPEGAQRHGDLVWREGLGEVDATVSDRLAQLAGVLAREAPDARPATGTPPSWPARAGWFTGIRKGLDAWQATRAERWAPGGGPPRRPVPCTVLGGPGTDFEHGSTWTLADAVLHLAAFDPGGLGAAGRALADAEAATRAQLAGALFYVWRVVRPASPARLLDVLDAFALHARPLDAGRLPYGLPPQPEKPPGKGWHLGYGDDVHVAPERVVMAGRPAAADRRAWAGQWLRQDARSMAWRRCDAHHWPAFTLGVMWLCTPIVAVRRPGVTPAEWLALDDPALAAAVDAVRRAEQDAERRDEPPDVWGRLGAWLPPAETLRALAAAVGLPGEG